MKKLILALAFMAGCVAYAEPMDTEYCLRTGTPLAYCSSDYYWVDGYYSWPYNYWHPGHYVRRWPASYYRPPYRPGYYHPYHPHYRR